MIEKDVTIEVEVFETQDTWKIKISKGLLIKEYCYLKKEKKEMSIVKAFAEFHHIYDIQ